jgi:glucan-binding YG repeat protein
MDKEVAAQGQAVIDKGPEKHFIQGNSYRFTEQLKALDCRWDQQAKAWYHLDKEVAAKAQDLVSRGTGKHYVTEVPYQLNEQMKQMGCRWDPEARSWYHGDASVAEQAQRLVQEHREKTKGQEPQLNEAKANLSVSTEVERGL